MAEGDHPAPDGQGGGSWNYHVEDPGKAASVAGSAPGGDPIEWTASEFIDHDKGPIWYVVLAAGTLGICAVLFFWLHDMVTIVAITVLAIMIGIMAARKPRTLQYRLDRSGLSAGKQFHPYGKFKAFAVIDEGAFASITFLPAKPFNLPVSVYFSPDDESKILEITARHLPLQPGALDVFDALMRSLHF
ncbi:MAG TPA: hypothetical protein VLF71_06000 [Candidatus Saccharimonadales bacterium]|nr:hypothetical protein [Candidatus Saccharimonadales bacterium]